MRAPLPPVTGEPWLKTYQTITTGIIGIFTALGAASVAWWVGHRQRQLTLNLAVRSEAREELKEAHTRLLELNQLRLITKVLTCISRKLASYPMRIGFNGLSKNLKGKSDSDLASFPKDSVQFLFGVMNARQR
jgi:hypothetical protein